MNQYLQLRKENSNTESQTEILTQLLEIANEQLEEAKKQTAEAKQQTIEAKHHTADMKNRLLIGQVAISFEYALMNIFYCLFPD